MPRPKKPGAPEPKRRSRNGCWPCKARKIKCGEEKPRCANCERHEETCDYSIRLNWGGRPKRDAGRSASATSSTNSSPYMSSFSFEDDVPSLFGGSDVPDVPTSLPQLTRSQSAFNAPRSDPSCIIDPVLVRMTSAPTQPTMSSMDHQSSFSDNLGFSNGDAVPASLAFDSSIPMNQLRGPFDYVTPATSSFEDHNFNRIQYEPTTMNAPISPPMMPPPARGQGYGAQNTGAGDSPELLSRRPETMHSAGSPPTTDAQSPPQGPPTPYNPFMVLPLTPTSIVGSEDTITRTLSKPASTSATYHAAESDFRRLSVQSLLNNSQGYSSDPQQSQQYPVMDHSTTYYGYDVGNSDLDSRNDDANAISVFTPASLTMELDEEDVTMEDREVRGKDMAFERGGYYAKPVAIRISKSLEPLPPLLLENPMNLLYFHHFLNHTARILVPHDCEQNPFRQLLPHMAVRDENIMNLVLAYSASHRAHLLHHPEPQNRIAAYVQDVFPKLREALANDENEITNAHLAPAIMMASLEIVAPNVFEVPITWQNHLAMARQMILSCGGPRFMHGDNPVSNFLARWFAYLEVLGSFSGNKDDQPLDSFHWSQVNSMVDDDYQIDCLTGFTNRCIGILARVAELAKICEPDRFDEHGSIRENWSPSDDIAQQAFQIRRELENGLGNPTVQKGCNHRSHDSSESEGAWDSTEIYATNEMFHWAGLIHLYRRVLGRPTMDPEVQYAVRQIIGLLHKVRRGSTADACLLFPMFAAGCAARDEVQREQIMGRLRAVEGFGMTQFHKARSLMQKVWDTGKPWESLVSGEFFG